MHQRQDVRSGELDGAACSHGSNGYHKAFECLPTAKLSPQEAEDTLDRVRTQFVTLYNTISSVTCPDCGMESALGLALIFHIHQNHGWQVPVSDRDWFWSCERCGRVWRKSAALAVHLAQRDTEAKCCRPVEIAFKKDDEHFGGQARLRI